MRVLRWIVRDIHADEPDRHRDDVAIARVAYRADEVGEDVGPADRHEEIARPHVHLPQIHDVGRQQLEVLDDGARPHGLAGH